MRSRSERRLPDMPWNSVKRTAHSDERQGPSSYTGEKSSHSAGSAIAISPNAAWDAYCERVWRLRRENGL